MDLIDRQAALDAIKTAELGCEYEAVEALPSVQPELATNLQPSCNQLATDCISRQAALEAIDTWDKFGCDPDGKLVRYDDDKHYIPYVHYEDMVHAVKNLPSVQPEEDTIEMQEADIDETMKRLRDARVTILPSAEPEKPYVIKMHRLIKADERERLEKELYRKLSQQSPILLDSDMELVYPVRMKGKWNKIHWKAYRCSECEWVSEYQSNFCPNCGADMRGTDD